jgi:glycosyltransferase involved in cell wall biosynthesis
MTVSIITVAYNAVGTIAQAINSVLGQSCRDIEHIIIDGGSSDGTVDVVKSYGNKIAKFVSEPDKGIYDAMNKGIKLAQGEVVGILNSDDLYADDSVLERVSGIFKEKSVDSCYGDIVYVDRTDTDKVIRYWRSGEYKRERFIWGWMPPHPAFFVKRFVYEKYGLFNLDFPIAADYELMLRFLYKFGISTIYIPEVLVKMRTEGNSNPGLSVTPRALQENYRAWKINGLKPNLITFVMKPLSKLGQFIGKAEDVQNEKFK